MFLVGFVQTRLNRLFEVGEIRIMLGIQALFPNETPKTLNQIEVRRIWRQEQQFDVELICQRLNDLTMLIACIIQDKGDRNAEVQVCDLLEQLTDTRRSNVTFVRNRDQLMGHCVDRTKHIEALASTRCLKHHTCKAPYKAKICLEDEMCRIYEKDRACTRLRLFEAGLELVFLNVACASVSCFSGILYVFNRFIPIFFKKSRTWVGFRRIPVSCSITAAASAIVVGGCCWK